MDAGAQVPESSHRAIRMFSRWKTNYQPPVVFRPSEVTLDDVRQVFDRYAMSSSWAFYVEDYEEAGVPPRAPGEPVDVWQAKAIEKLDTPHRRVCLRRLCSFMAHWATYREDGHAAGVFSTLTAQLRHGLSGSLLAQVLMEVGDTHITSVEEHNRAAAQQKQAVAVNQKNGPSDWMTLALSILSVLQDEEQDPDKQGATSQ
jgi:hypothetical protein